MTIDHHAQPVTTAAWAPDGQSFITGSLDKEDQLCLWNLDGHEIYRWSINYRIVGCAISSNGQKLVTISLERQIFIYNFVTRENEYHVESPAKMTCVSISRDSKYVLVSMADRDVYLYDIDTADIIRKYSGKQQGACVIRSSFGGSDENMVVSGSEGDFHPLRFEINRELTIKPDSKIYIWHKENGTLIEELQGHANPGCVNAVTWNPADPGMFASGGDDKVIRIWAKAPEPAVRRRVSSQASSHRSNRTSFALSTRSL